jgi:RHS repeat-associated protein
MTPNYSPYGYQAHAPLSRLGFTGQPVDAITGHYPLGNGRRSYSASLMRFCASDRLSPFSAGGINSYAYCAGDPVNRTDPSGNAPVPAARNTTTPPSISLGQHYAARGANAAGSLVGMGMSFIEIALEYDRWQLQHPGTRLPPLHRLRRVSGFYALAAPAAGDVYELFLSPQNAERAGLVDNLGLAGAGGFGLEAAVGIVQTVRTEGLAGLKVSRKGLAYALKEVTGIGPAADLTRNAYRGASWFIEESWRAFFPEPLADTNSQIRQQTATRVTRL